jgi:hypothetical protein
MEDQLYPLDLLKPEQQQVLNFWRDLGGERLRCSLKDFELSKLPPALLPTTMIVDIFSDFSENCFRFWGTRMTQIHGRDMTGCSPYDLSPPEMGQAVRRQHEKIVTQPEASASRFVFLRDGVLEHTHNALRLPLSGDSDNVTNLAIIVDLSPQERGYKKNGSSTRRTPSS